MKSVDRVCLLREMALERARKVGVSLQKKRRLKGGGGGKDGGSQLCSDSGENLKKKVFREDQVKEEYKQRNDRGGRSKVGLVILQDIYFIRVYYFLG